MTRMLTTATCRRLRWEHDPGEKDIRADILGAKGRSAHPESRRSECRWGARDERLLRGGGTSPTGEQDDRMGRNDGNVDGMLGMSTCRWLWSRQFVIGCAPVGGFGRHDLR